MKKAVLKVVLLAGMLLAVTQRGQAQQHEVKWNIINTIVLASVEVGYEYFIDGSQSVGADILINDVYNFSIGREIKDFKTSSFQLTYNYYISNADDGSGIMITPLMKYRFGEYQQTEEDPVINMNSFILGIGGGYKWNFNDKFIVAPFANIARNFSSEVNDEFNIAVELNAGINIGYRF